MASKNTTRGTVYLSIHSILFMFSGFAINLLLGRLLGPEEYGLYGIVISLVTIINLIQTTGIPQAVSKYIAEDGTRSDAVLTSGLWLQVLCTIILTLLLFFTAQPLSVLFGNSNLVHAIQLSAFILPLYGIFSLYIGYYNGLHDFKKQSVISIIYSISKSVTVILLALFFKLPGAIIGFIISPLVSIIMGFNFPKELKNTFSYRKLILFSLPLIGFSFLANLQQTLDLYFVKALVHNNASAGFYTASQNIARIPFFTLNAFAVMMFPSISKNISLNLHQESRNLIHQSLRAINLLLIPSTFLLSATSGQIIKLIYSDAYLPGASVLSVLIFGMGFLTIFMLLANILSGAGKPGLVTWISMGSVIITGILCFFFIPILGIEGAALATTIGAFIATGVAAFYVYQRFQALLSIPRFIKIITPSIIIYFLAKLIVVPLLFLPLLYIVLFALYFAFLILLKEITFKDLNYISDLLPRKLLPAFLRNE